MAVSLMAIMSPAAVASSDIAYILPYEDSMTGDSSHGAEAISPSGGGIPAGSAGVQSTPVKETCSDGYHNQDEVSVDCGGICTTKAEETCDGKDNDNDCYADEDQICESENENKNIQKGVGQGELCVKPLKEKEHESSSDYYSISTPSCILAEDFGSLDFSGVLNLTKLNGKEKGVLNSILAYYINFDNGERCSVLLTKYSEKTAESGIFKASNSMDLASENGLYYYGNLSDSTTLWKKAGYVVLITPYDPANNWAKTGKDCSALFSPYLKKLGSDLTSQGFSQPAQDETVKASVALHGEREICEIFGEGDKECHKESEASGRQQPDKNGMVMDCQYSPETKLVECTKVKASGIVASQEANVESPASSSAGANDESQVKKIRRISKQYNIYLSNYTDGQLLGSLQKFGDKHAKEFQEKYGGQEPGEEKVAEILSQFSKEEFGEHPIVASKPQTQSFFRKVRGFFKRIF